MYSWNLVPQSWQKRSNRENMVLKEKGKSTVILVNLLFFISITELVLLILNLITTFRFNFLVLQDLFLYYVSIIVYIYIYVSECMHNAWACKETRVRWFCLGLVDEERCNTSQIFCRWMEVVCDWMRFERGFAAFLLQWSYIFEGIKKLGHAVKIKVKIWIYCQGCTVVGDINGWIWA